jgi:serine protease Do
MLLSACATVQEDTWVKAPQSVVDLQGIQSSMQRVLPLSKRVTVAILGDGSGSGVIVSRSGLVLTAGHVCGERGTELRVILVNGDSVKAKSLGAIKMADAGLVQLEPGVYPFAEVGPADAPLPLGTWCFALGHPGGWNPERGAVVRLGRVISLAKHTLRSDCKLVGGDSGGPLFDLQGRVIAIHSRISRAADQNFHVPMTTYRQQWPDLMPGRVVAMRLSSSAIAFHSPS